MENSRTPNTCQPYQLVNPVNLSTLSTYQPFQPYHLFNNLPYQRNVARFSNSFPVKKLYV